MIKVIAYSPEPVISVSTQVKVTVSDADFHVIQTLSQFEHWNNTVVIIKEAEEIKY